MEMLAGWRAVSLARNDKGRVDVIKEASLRGICFPVG